MKMKIVRYILLALMLLFCMGACDSAEQRR